MLCQFYKIFVYAEIKSHPSGSDLPGKSPFPAKKHDHFPADRMIPAEQSPMQTQRNNILDHVGHTPLVPIHRLNPNQSVEVLAKLEYFNPGGSIKDRPALYMIEEAERSGELTRDKIILEATSGNTGIGLAMVAAVKGYRILLSMSESVSEERVKILKAFGAEIKFTPAHMGTDGAIEYVYNLMREAPDKYWLADQFNNENNWKAHYMGTALEIWEQTAGQVSAIVATMGTSGTLMGLAKRYAEMAPHVSIVGVEPYMGHKIQGLKNMKESYQPGIFDKRVLSRIENVDDEEAFETARQLARKEGMLVGMSSGAAMAVALRIAREMTEGKIVVLLPDGGERYLSTALFTTKKRSGLHIYNTFSRRKEELIPIEENHVKMYCCGPTLCQYIHLGHARRFLFADLLRRYLGFKGYRVTLVTNLTDLDDRTIQGAEKAGMPLKDFTEGFNRAFMEDIERLGIEPATVYPKASEHVEEMIDLARRLLQKGYAYEKFRSIYFDISRFKPYGNLSHIDLTKIRVGKTVDLDNYEKDNPRDFTLLKRATLNALKRGIFYQTQWGNVLPSWHLECSAMAMKYLGPTYDIHTSGIELIFPHHENAIAISQALTNQPPANYWVHHENVLVNGKRTSKAADVEGLTLREIFEQGYSGRDIRFLILSRHYRKPIVFSWTKLNAARSTIARLDGFVQRIHNCPDGRSEPEADQIVYDLRHGFTEALDDDLNVAAALAALFQFIRRVNGLLDRNMLAKADKQKFLEILAAVNGVLGVLDLEPAALEGEIEASIRARAEARRRKDWETADRIRDRLKERGIELLDTPEGTIWQRTSTGPGKS